MNAQKGYLGKPDKKNIPQLCSLCHSDPTYMRGFNPALPTDQYQQYLNSQHGILLTKGDSKVAVCTDCHGSHNIQPANMATSKIFPNTIPATCGACHSDRNYMKSYGIPTNQLELYQTSVHGLALFEKGDRSAPTCNDCHGNHGAFPPGIKSISHVCGTCHLSQAEMFIASPHYEAFAESSLPQCESCHGNHAVQPTIPAMLGVGEGAFCIQCHEESSSGYHIAKRMKAKEDSLIAKIDLSDSLLEKAEKAGVETSDGKFLAKDAHDVLIKARNSVHYFSLEKFDQIIRAGYDLADLAIAEGRSALKEAQNRRLALAVISIIIFIAAMSLYFQIRSMEHK